LKNTEKAVADLKQVLQGAQKARQQIDGAVGCQALEDAEKFASLEDAPVVKAFE
jgi:hypothetical protein